MKKQSNTKSAMRFPTPGTKLAFTELKQAFMIASILYYLNPESHIWIVTDILGHVISEILVG